jgi:hypothetical protein
MATQNSKNWGGVKGNLSSIENKFKKKSKIILALPPVCDRLET